MGTTKMDLSLSFSSSFKVTEKELVLSYEVQNRSNRDAYLFTGVYFDYPYTADPNAIYIHFERDTKTVWLNKMIPAIPEGVSPYEPASPVQSPLRAGATFREEVRVPLPIRERRAYEEVPSRPEGTPVLASYEGMRFTLQYYWRTEGMIEEMVDMGGVKVLATRGGAPLKDSDFGHLESERVTLRVPVLEPP